MNLQLEENVVAKEVVDAAFHVHVDLGPGLLESVYEGVLARRLQKRGLAVERQKPIPIFIDGLVVDEGFRADLVVNDLIVIELKSVEQMSPVFRKQLRTYLKFSGKRLGLLINFGMELFKDGIARVVLGLDERTSQPAKLPQAPANTPFPPKSENIERPGGRSRNAGPTSRPLDVF